MDGQRHGGCEGQHPAGARDPDTAREDRRGVGVELVPQQEEQRRGIDRPAMQDREPRSAEFWLERQRPGRPLCRHPPGQHDHGQDQQSLPT